MVITPTASPPRRSTGAAMALMPGAYISKIMLTTELDVQLGTIQSNHEGALVDFLHRHIDQAQGALVNPAGLTAYPCTTPSRPCRIP
jgi:hypothetical protein